MKIDFKESLGVEFSEADIWENRVKPFLVGVPENVVTICGFGLTEMLNNANDHSASDIVGVSVFDEENEIKIDVVDLGVGIFRHLMTKHGFENTRQAVFELTKGKLTSDPLRHTGQGIFYTSLMFDNYLVMSGSTGLARRGGKTWILADESPPPRGTIVRMSIDRNSTRTAREVSREWTVDEDTNDFSKTRVYMSLAQEEKSLISRAQAKRIVNRLDQFSEVVLDFEGLDWISPSFADEIFRVYVGAHPGLKVKCVNANPDIKKMLALAKADARTEQT